MKKQLEEVLKELTLSFKEYFETQLAELIIHDASIIKIVAQVSASIVDIIIRYQKEVVQIIETQNKFEADLYNREYFGSLTRNDHLDTLQQVLAALKNTQQNPTQALFIHMCFIHRIYDYLPHAQEKIDQKAQVVKTIYNPRLFADRARLPRADASSLASHTMGICRATFFKNKMQVAAHVPGKDRYSVDKKSAFYHDCKRLMMPAVCGPSGHTGSLLILTAMLGNLTASQLQDYFLFTASFLVSAGCHSFHESFLVANTMGVEYAAGNYRSLFHHKTPSTEIQTFLTENEHLLTSPGDNYVSLQNR